MNKQSLPKSKLPSSSWVFYYHHCRGNSSIRNWSTEHYSLKRREFWWDMTKASWTAHLQQSPGTVGSFLRLIYAESRPSSEANHNRWCRWRQLFPRGFASLMSLVTRAWNTSQHWTCNTYWLVTLADTARRRTRHNSMVFGSEWVAMPRGQFPWQPHSVRIKARSEEGNGQVNTSRTIIAFINRSTSLKSMWSKYILPSAFYPSYTPYKTDATVPTLIIGLKSWCLKLKRNFT